MSIQYIRGNLIDLDPTLFDASLNNDGLIVRVSKTDNIAPPTTANKFALSCIVQGDGVAFINTGTTVIPVWNQLSTDGDFTVSGTLTAGMINSLSTPVQILPSAQPGTAYAVTSWRMRYVPGTIPFTLPFGFVIRIVSGVSTVWAQNTWSALTVLTQDTKYTKVGGTGGFDLIDGADLNFTNIGIDSSNGDGTIEYTVTYKVITL